MSAKETPLLNDQIRYKVKEVRCIGDDGHQYGIISSSEAWSIAEEKALDLVMISPTATPPVCKIMDYKKYRYEQEKKLKEARKKQKVIEVKEIKLSIKIAKNDVAYKVKHAREFLEEEKHVRFRVFLKGRENENPGPAYDLLGSIYEMVADVAEKEKEPTQEGRYVNMLVLPKKAKNNLTKPKEKLCPK